MAANATLGALLRLDTASTFNTISQRVRIKPNEHSRAKLETTDLDSTWETSLAGIKRAGEIECEVNYDASLTQHARIWSSFGSGTVENWKLVLTDASNAEFAFSGWISGIAVGEAKVDGVQTMTVKIQISGAVVLTP